MRPAVAAALCLLALMLLLVQPRGSSADHITLPQVTNLAHFEPSIRRVQIGMSVAQVLKILGRPDDIRTEADNIDHGMGVSDETWCYGADSHLGFPIYGRVLMRTGKVVSVAGSAGKPLDPAMFTEAERRELLSLIDRLPGAFSRAYDPLPVIRLVNRLQPLGKERTIAILTEYLRVTDPWESGAWLGITFALRSLFDWPRESGSPQPRIPGQVGPQRAWDDRNTPRFPLAIQDDIPLLLTSNIQPVNGWNGMVQAEVEYFRKHGELRSRPLHPVDDPLEALARLERTRQFAVWPGGDRPIEAQRQKTMNQLLRLLTTVYRPDPNWYGDLIAFGPKLDERWAAVRAEVARLRIRWDERQSCYVFPDGRTLPEEPRSLGREVWRMRTQRNWVTVTVARRDRKWVRVEMRWSSREGGGRRPILRALDASNGRTLESLSTTTVLTAEQGIAKRDRPRVQTNGTAGLNVELMRGGELQLEVTDGSSKHLSRLYIP